MTSTAPPTPAPRSPAAGAPESWRPRIEPVAPHDDLPFDELARRYNHRLTTDRRMNLVRLIMKELAGRPRPTRVLDIGAGAGIGKGVDFQRALGAHCDELWGIEPDHSVQPVPGLFTRFEHALMETAALPADHFDVAYAFMVMEHVESPGAFLAALRRTLKPGGVFLFMTPNLRHYFTFTAGALHKLRIEELALRLLRRKSKIEQYHYPVRYRFNSPHQIDRRAREAGFDRPAYAYLESEGPRPYMRGPLRPIYHLLDWKRRVIRNPRCLLTLTGRMTKPAPGPAAGASRAVGSGGDAR